ncbi:hypothetical protein LTR22_023164 [Elasticomyces elasticus]|nr:hypothetical protein LTR22_023164 [Elasticomyces elasticus]
MQEELFRLASLGLETSCRRLTTFGGYDPSNSMASPQSTCTDPSYTPLTPQYGYRMGSDSGYAETMYKPSFGGSGNVTLQDFEFSSMFGFQEPLTQEEQWLA